MIPPPTIRTWPLALTAAILLCCSACNRQTQPPPTLKTRPAAESPVATPAPSRDSPATDQPTTQPAATPTTKPTPATRPDELPPSTFDTRPPYTVQLYVRKPEDKQPGWLKILTLDDAQAVAKANGVFPRQNIIEVATGNVRSIRVELGYLPLAEGKRVILRIDDQGIEITQRDRRFITLERRPTGQWAVLKPPQD